MEFLNRALSRPRAHGISVSMGGGCPSVRGVGLVATLALLAAASCDMEALRSGALYPKQDAAADAAETPADAPAESAARDAAAEAAPDAERDLASDGAAEADGVGADATPDAAGEGPSDDAGPGLDGSADLAGPTGMLSGSVIDTCRGFGVDALVGIGGRHTCSYRDKGSYFFPRLPVGTLKIAASKEGYALYEATIEIVAGGNVHDIRLIPAADGGCASLPSPPVACTCTASTCEP